MRWIQDYDLREEEIFGKSHFERFPKIPALNLIRCLERRKGEGNV